MSDVLVDVRDLKQHFSIRTGLLKKTPLKAVDGVYTVTVTSTESVIEVVYDTPNTTPQTGCIASATSILWFLPLCGLALLKKRKES